MLSHEEYLLKYTSNTEFNHSVVYTDLKCIISVTEKFAVFYINTGWGDMIHLISLCINQGITDFMFIKDKPLSFKSHSDDPDTFGEQLTFICELFGLKRSQYTFIAGTKPENQNSAILDVIKNRPKLALIKNAGDRVPTNVTYQHPDIKKVAPWKLYDVANADAIIRQHPASDFVSVSYRMGIKEVYNTLLNSKIHYTYYGASMWLAVVMGIPTIVMHASTKTNRKSQINNNLSIRNMRTSHIKVLLLDK